MTEMNEEEKKSLDEWNEKSGHCFRAGWKVQNRNFYPSPARCSTDQNNTIQRRYLARRRTGARRTVVTDWISKKVLLMSEEAKSLVDAWHENRFSQSG